MMTQLRITMQDWAQAARLATILQKIILNLDRVHRTYQTNAIFTPVLIVVSCQALNSPRKLMFE